MARISVSPRSIVLVALGVWLLISAYMLVILGEELDMDSVFYGFSDTGGRTVIHGSSYVPPPSNPPPVVVAAFVTVGVVVGLPVLFLKRWFSIALHCSTIVVGLVLTATILRLGVLLTPVLALQLWAHGRLRGTQ